MTWHELPLGSSLPRSRTAFEIETISSSCSILSHWLKFVFLSTHWTTVVLNWGSVDQITTQDSGHLLGNAKVYRLDTSLNLYTFPLDHISSKQHLNHCALGIFVGLVVCYSGVIVIALKYDCHGNVQYSMALHRLSARSPAERHHDMSSKKQSVGNYDVFQRPQNLSNIFVFELKYICALRRVCLNLF